MDVLYILGTGSLSDNKELVYSIRSLRAHMLDLGNIYIVGATPPDDLDVIHIPADDIYDEKWKNAFYKTRMGCLNDDISDDFLLMNDDFFALSPFLGSELPFFAIKGRDGGNSGPICFQVHKPMRINKELYLSMPLDLDMKGSFSPRNFYGNFNKCPATFTNDHILVVGKNVKSYDEQIKKLDFFTIDDVAMKDSSFLDFLEKLYPNDE